MKKPIILSAVGGDGRQFFITKLLEQKGFKIRRYGIVADDISGVNTEKTLEDALSGADYLLLPIPVTKDGYRLNSCEDILLSDLIKKTDHSCCVFAGKMPPAFKDLLEGNGIKYYDYFDDTAYVWRNADITAEGAIYLLMRELDITLRDSKILVCGYGRIGKCLSKKLKALGAFVTVAARKREDIMLADICGDIHTDELNYRRAGIFDLERSYDAVFNTVPSWIFDASNTAIVRDSIYIELASAPYGGEVEFMKKNCRKYIMGSALPGKYAPLSAARAVFRSLLEFLEKEDDDT